MVDGNVGWVVIGKQGHSDLDHRWGSSGENDSWIIGGEFAISTDNNSLVIIGESSYQGLMPCPHVTCAMFKGSLIVATEAWKVADAASVSSLCR